MSVKFSVEDVRLLWRELKPLVERHQLEVRGPDEAPAPDFDHYNQAQSDGDMVLFTVRDGLTSVLVGYCSVFLLLDNHRNGKLCGHQDALYIEKSYRRGLTGLNFIKYIESYLPRIGVTTIFQGVTPSVDFSNLLVRLRYQKVTTIFAKTIGDGS